MARFCAARRSADLGAGRAQPRAPQGPAARPRRRRRPAELPCRAALQPGARTQADGRREGDLISPGSVSGRDCMNAQCCRPVAMDLGVYQLRHFSISFLSSLLGTDNSSLRLDSSSSGASVVAIDNKIEQAMDLVKSHLMYAVREEVEVLKEQIKELIEKNSQLEQENTLLKTLASPEQLAQFQAQLQTGSPPSSSQSQGTTQQPAQPASQGSGPSV
ncbi:TSC22 domain family protein 1 isoform X3 [Grus americana]|nr:TSC22 domain family protein 1 isoform X3 [Grus americana]